MQGNDRIFALQRVPETNLAYKISQAYNQFGLSFVEPNTHSSFSNSSGMTKLGFFKSWCAPISLILPWSWSRAQKKTFYVINTQVPFFYRFNQSVQSPTRHLESVWRRKFFRGLWISSMEILMILVRIRIYKSPISACLNYY